MKLLVTFALENEFAPWRALREFRADKWGEADVYRAQIGAAEVGVILTGAGPKQAHLETAKVLAGDPDSIHLCVSSGLAGALKAEYRIGQVLQHLVGVDDIERSILELELGDVSRLEGHVRTRRLLGGSSGPFED